MEIVGVEPADGAETHRRDGVLIVERLSAAGWQLAEGAAVLGRPALTYSNGRMVIELTQDDQRRELALILVAPGGEELTVFPVYGDHLGPTLDAVIGFQDRVGPDTFHDAIRELVAVCPEVYVQDGEEGEALLLTQDS